MWIILHDYRWIWVSMEDVFFAKILEVKIVIHKNCG
jgi:hypothetical protein